MAKQTSINVSGRSVESIDRLSVLIFEFFSVSVSQKIHNVEVSGFLRTQPQHTNDRV